MATARGVMLPADESDDEIEEEAAASSVPQTREEIFQEARRQADAAYAHRVAESKRLTAMGCYRQAQEALDYMPSSASEISDEDDRRSRKSVASAVSEEENSGDETSAQGGGSSSDGEECETESEEGEEESSADEPFLAHAKEGMKSALAALFEQQVEARGQSAETTFDNLRALSTHALRQVPAQRLERVLQQSPGGADAESPPPPGSLSPRAQPHGLQPGPIGSKFIDVWKPDEGTPRGGGQRLRTPSPKREPVADVEASDDEGGAAPRATRVPDEDAAAARRGAPRRQIS